MKTLIDLEKKINSELASKINKTDIYYIEVSIEFPDNINQINFDESVKEFIENY